MFSQRLFILSIMFILVTLTPHEIDSSERIDGMKVHFIDVGQGDSMLIQTPTNKTILIDGGPPESAKKLINYLEKHDITEIDLLIVTHPDIDHIGGLPRLMKSIHIKQIIESGKFHTTRTYDQYVNEIIKRKIRVNLAKQDDRIHIDPLLRIRILNTYDYFKTNNEASIVLHIQFGEINLLLMGDIGEKQEKQIIKKYDLTADIVKIAHHGSSTSSSMEFLQSIQPKIALLSYRKNNDYNHPHNEVIERLLKTRATIYSTAVYGDIVIHTDGKRFIVTTEKSPIDGLLLNSS